MKHKIALWYVVIFVFGCLRLSPAAGMEPLPGFDASYYLSAKLAALQASDPEWLNSTVTDLQTVLGEYGFTAESHYSKYGYLEGLEPNAYFNHSEYIFAKANAMFHSGAYPSVPEAEAAFASAWPFDAYQHYLLYGAAEGVNPSNSFDESAYLTDKLELLQENGDEWDDKTINDLRSFLASLHMTVLDHYMNYGRNEGLVLTPVLPDEDPTIPSEFVVLAWNDLGMHCLNPTYDTAVILPPYNTVWAQVIQRGNNPKIVTSGITVEYRIINNTFSDGKTYPPFGSDYGQFWTHVVDLFGVNLTPNTGLNLVDATLNNGLSGTMVPSGDHFEVDGIPLTPVSDTGIWNPYQVAEITVKNSTGTVLAKTLATVPTSDEIRCNKCHGTDAFLDVLNKHDADQGTTLAASTPVLCASCHGSPVLGTVGPGVMYLSQAIHGFHANQGASCYDCHPGTTTRCNRSLAHTAPNGNCTSCHGSMADMAASIASGAKVPWMNEPKCADCHYGVAEVDNGEVLYRNSKGHGGVYCSGCHGSPHAMIPSSEASDNYQAIQYQGKALSLGSCAACHSNSRGEGASEFLEEHGGAHNPSACAICHTAFTSAKTIDWPHQYQWRAR